MRARALKKRGLVEEAKAQFAKREVISGASTTLSAAPPTYTELQKYVAFLTGKKIFLLIVHLQHVVRARSRGH